MLINPTIGLNKYLELLPEVLNGGYADSEESMLYNGGYADGTDILTIDGGTSDQS